MHLTNILFLMILWIQALHVHHAVAYSNLSEVPSHLYPFGPEDEENPVDVTWYYMRGPHLRQILPESKPMKFMGNKIIEIMEKESGSVLLYDVIHKVWYNGFHAPIFHGETLIGEVAPFESDLHLRMGGHVTYRFVDKRIDRNLMKRASLDVRKAFPCSKRFYANGMFIVTWYNVNFFQYDWLEDWIENGEYCDFYVNDYCCSPGSAHYGFFCSGIFRRSADFDEEDIHKRDIVYADAGNEKAMRNLRDAEFDDRRVNIDKIDTTLGLNTFQAVFIYNKARTYVMYNYGEINWVDFATAFVASDRANYTLPASGTEAMREIEETTNCGTRGRWMFRVDSAKGVKQPADC